METMAGQAAHSESEMQATAVQKTIRIQWGIRAQMYEGDRPFYRQMKIPPASIACQNAQNANYVDTF